MNLDPLKLCDREDVAGLFEWMATECWCCSGVRGILVFVPASLLIGWLLPSWGWLGWMFGVATVAGLAAVAWMVATDNGQEERK